MGPSWLLELPSTVLRKPEPLAPRKSFLYLEFALLSYPPLLLESQKTEVTIFPEHLLAATPHLGGIWAG
jgi:hypothetical protein